MHCDGQDLKHHHCAQCSRSCYLCKRKAATKPTAGEQKEGAPLWLIIETNEANLFSRATSISKNKEKKRKLADESFNDKFQQIQSNFDKVLAAETHKQLVDGCHHFGMRAAEKLKGLPPVKRLRLQSKMLSDIAQAMEHESHSNALSIHLCF